MATCKQGLSKMTKKVSNDFDNRIIDKFELIIEAKIDQKLKIANQRIAELESENRRMKIALRFLESEIKHVKSKSYANCNGVPTTNGFDLDTFSKEDTATESVVSDAFATDSNTTETHNDPPSKEKYCNVTEVLRETIIAAMEEEKAKEKEREIENCMEYRSTKEIPNEEPSKEKSTDSIIDDDAATENGDVSENGIMEIDDEIEEVPPPPPRPPLAVIDLSEDEEDECVDQPEISLSPECTIHPISGPVLPFVIADEQSMPAPVLKARTGLGRDGKKAVVLRMESKISGKSNLQYRVFSYYENEAESPRDRKWKQLTCIKVQSGRVCECTLTHLIETVRYHFAVCLVHGNNRSKFSNCVPHVY